MSVTVAFRQLLHRILCAANCISFIILFFLRSDTPVGCYVSDHLTENGD